MKFKEYLDKTVYESINPYSAVLVAHTSSNKDSKYMNNISNATKDLQSCISKGNLTENDLKNNLIKNNITLKSKHPSAIQKLHANLLKVK